MIKSKALEVNLASYHVDVVIDEKYAVFQRVMSKYYGLQEGLNVFLKELSHPYRNWSFIVAELRHYALEYFHLFQEHPQGPDAALLVVDIFVDAIDSARAEEVKIEAVDNLLLFLMKISKDAGRHLDRFQPVLIGGFDQIRRHENDEFFWFVKSYYQINRLAAVLSGPSANGTDRALQTALNRLLLKYYRHTYLYWMSVRDPWTWFEEELAGADLKLNKQSIQRFFREISHEHIQSLIDRLHHHIQAYDAASRELTDALVELPGYGQLVEIYRQIPQQLLDAGLTQGQGNRWKVIFLFHIINISGLSLIHEEVLRDITRTVSWLIDHETVSNIRSLIQKTLTILKVQTVSFPASALNCIFNMGKGVYRTDENDLVNYFIDGVIYLGFQSPMLNGVDDDWQIKANSAHIQNIRTWLELIKLNPKWSTRLMSMLIIQLSLGGIFVKDTDLFPRDITGLLNSDIGPVYNLTKQLLRLFPVYFNDIGAEGRLRDISTRIDEISHRRDPLIHFLRKQSHVESSNKIIDFMEATLHFWTTKDKDPLQPHVPSDIFEQISVDGPHIDGVHVVMAALQKQGIVVPKGLLSLSAADVEARIGRLDDVSAVDAERIALIIEFYKLLNQKYNVGFTELTSDISQLSTEAFPDLNRLKSALSEPDHKKKLFMLLDYLKHLKKTILSPKTFEIKEDIYKKRHITIDIPSMYGSYHELKFDALGLTFRIECLVNVLFEELIDNLDLSLITKATFYQIYARIRLFDMALKLDGISSVEIERQLDLLGHSLEVKGFSYTQYLDIFKGFATAVKNIINDYFHNIHDENLAQALARMPKSQILPKYLPFGEDRDIDLERIRFRASEIFFRDQITMSLGLQQLDRFVSRILNILYQQSDQLPKDKLHQLLIYDPKNAMTAIDKPDNRVNGLIYLGNKGLNLIRLQSFGLPVPPGFIITTEVFRCWQMIESYAPAKANLKEQIAHHIAMLERSTGQFFGHREKPLLFSVRSGSSISQPGMMDTFLNVGMTEEIAAGLAEKSGNAWFAWDNYRRFLQCYGMAFGLERDDFDAIINELKRRAGIEFKRFFTGDQMKKVAMTYKTRIFDSGIEVLEDPFEQLVIAINGVFASWDSVKAQTYRKIMGISDDWGTAVTVQAMVFGNRSDESGTGVAFTHNPKWPGESIRLWGDFSLGNQGEDVVSGLVNTLPISINQQEVEMRQTDVTLESHFPDIYHAMRTWTNDLIYERGWSPQEIEFTFESPSAKDLYLLQSRDMAIRERKKVSTFDLLDKTEERYLGHGIGISGGAMSGRLVFSLEEIDEWRRREPSTKLILARSDTVPDDIREIHAADGLLTARGGVTSHASVVAHRLGKTCVVGCGELTCDEKNKSCFINHMHINSGDHISIDGQEGSVYLGQLRVSNP